MSNVTRHQLYICRPTGAHIRLLARRLAGAIALQGKCQTRRKVMGCKVFCFVGLQATFLCVFREGRRGRKWCCVRLCGKSAQAVAKEPQCDASRANSFKTFHVLCSQSSVSSKAETVQSRVGHRRHKKNTVLLFNSVLPTVNGCPLSGRGLSTPRLPSIPGLFLCARQHPASDCLKLWTSLQRGGG